MSVKKKKKKKAVGVTESLRGLAMKEGDMFVKA